MLRIMSPEPLNATQNSHNSNLCNIAIAQAGGHKKLEIISYTFYLSQTFYRHVTILFIDGQFGIHFFCAAKSDY